MAILLRHPLFSLIFLKLPLLINQNKLHQQNIETEHFNHYFVTDEKTLGSFCVGISHYKVRKKKGLFEHKSRVQSKLFRKSTFLQELCWVHVYVLNVCAERNPVFITPMCPYGKAVSMCGRWWGTGVQQHGGVCVSCSVAQKRLSLLHHCLSHSNLTFSVSSHYCSVVLCVSVWTCACGLVENRVFPSEVSVRGSARSHWQSTAMLN